MNRRDILNTIQEYSEHVDKIRNVFIAKLDKVVNAGPIIDKKELKRVINVFRYHKYMNRDSFNKERVV